MCSNCPNRKNCIHLCRKVINQLPHPEKGRIPLGGGRSRRESLERIHDNRSLMFAVLDHRHVLRGREKVAFDLYFNEGFSQEEIGQRMGLTRSGARNHLARAFIRIVRRIMRARRRALKKSQKKF